MSRKKKSKPTSAKELLKELHADPEWVARREAEEKKRKARSAVLIANEAPLVADLRAAGFDVESAWDLFNRKEPWRKDVPIPEYSDAIPILVRNLDRPYHFLVREGIVRALTAKWGRVALDRLVEELRCTRDSGPEEKERAVEMVLAGVADLYGRKEVERTTAFEWEGYRFAIANAVGYHFQEEHIPTILDLIRDQGHGDDVQRTLVEYLRKKMRRWRRTDPEILAVIEQVEGEGG